MTAPSVVAHPERLGLFVEGLDGAPGAVEDAVAVVVLETEDLVADGELSEAEGHLVWSQPAGCVHAPTGQPVELGAPGGQVPSGKDLD
ncbi:MAG: hypothetical protein ACR2JF_15500 [Iamia sp.]